MLLAGGTKGALLPLTAGKDDPPALWPVGGQVPDIEIQAKEILKTRETLNEILAYTEQPIERIAKDTDRDFYMSARKPRSITSLTILTRQYSRAGKKRTSRPTAISDKRPDDG